MSRSVNFAVIVGNLTRDPEMRYTPQGHAVTSFSVATNRYWVSDGERQESTEFHNIVSWNKLAELCSQLLQKGTKVYIQGRLQTRTWDDDKGVRHYKTEIVADDMVVLERRKAGGQGLNEEGIYSGEEKEDASTLESDIVGTPEGGKKEDKKKKGDNQDSDQGDEEVEPKEIPF